MKVKPLPTPPVQPVATVTVIKAKKKPLRGAALASKQAKSKRPSSLSSMITSAWKKSW